MEKQKFKELTNKRIFTVTFYKKDGSVRKLNGIQGGKEYVKGTGKLSDKVIGVWDIPLYKKGRKAGQERSKAGSGAFRSVLPDTIISLRVNGHEYDADGKMIK